MSEFHKDQKVKFVKRRGGVETHGEGKYVGKKTGAKGDWHEIDTGAGHVKVRAANVSAA